jgi:hypothetical protein
MAGCGTSPSPPISLLVSMITTRLPWRSLKTRASSRMTVVFPTPGRPRNKMLSLPSASRSSIMSTCPFSARPTRQVRPTTEPERLRMAEMRCSVPAMPARLSPPKSPIAAIAASKSPRVTGSARRHWLGAPFAKRASGQRPRSSTTSSRSPRRACVNNASRTSTGSICASVAVAADRIEGEENGVAQPRFRWFRCVRFTKVRYGRLRRGRVRVCVSRRRVSRVRVAANDKTRRAFER